MGSSVCPVLACHAFTNWSHRGIRLHPRVPATLSEGIMEEGMPGLPDHLLRLQLRGLIMQTPTGFQLQGIFKKAECTPPVSLSDAS